MGSRTHLSYLLLAHIQASAAAATAELIKKQEELNRKAEELDRRERELQHAALGGTTSKWVLSNRGMLRSFQTEWNGICL